MSGFAKSQYQEQYHSMCRVNDSNSNLWINSVVGCHFRSKHKIKGNDRIVCSFQKAYSNSLLTISSTKSQL